MTDRLEPESITDSVEREQLIPAAPDRVWEVLIGDGWLADEVTLELTPGGEASFRWTDSSRHGWVEEAVESERLIFWWADDGEPASRVELLLQPEGEEETRLRVIESLPLESLDVFGIPLPGTADTSRGPVLLAA